MYICVCEWVTILAGVFSLLGYLKLSRENVDTWVTPHTNGVVMRFPAYPAMRPIAYNVWT